MLWALLFLSSALITGSISKSRKQFNVVSEFFPVRWKKRHSISWHSIESDSSPWWWALPFLYVTSSGVLKVALSRLVILPRRIIPQFQSPEQMNLIPDQKYTAHKYVPPRTSSYLSQIRWLFEVLPRPIHWSVVKKSHLLFIKPAFPQADLNMYLLGVPRSVWFDQSKDRHIETCSKIIPLEKDTY